eukprot:6200136-Pleurochrysis_carterae.AAC.3
MLVVGEYSVDAIELGAGGYGAVYKGKETATGKPVAVKVLSHGRMRVAAIQHEVKLMQNARHKHVIELYVHIQQEDKSFLVMELAEHGELFSRVIDKGNLDEPEAKVYFAQIMGALDFLHGRGIAHRDLKLVRVPSATQTKFRCTADPSVAPNVPAHAPNILAHAACTQPLSLDYATDPSMR